MKEILSTSQMDETSETFTLMTYPTPIYSAEDFPARLFQLLGEGLDSVQKTLEVLSFLRYVESLNLSEHRIYSLKMLRDSSTTTEDEPSESSSLVWMNWGTTSNGSVLTARILESRKIGSGYSLSEILEDTPDQKYFLSDSALQKMLTKQEEKRVAEPTDMETPQRSLFDSGGEATSER